MHDDPTQLRIHFNTSTQIVIEKNLPPVSPLCVTTPKVLLNKIVGEMIDRKGPSKYIEAYQKLVNMALYQ